MFACLTKEAGKCSRRLFSTIQKGRKYTKEFQTYLIDDSGRPASFFHDVPLDLNPKISTASMVIEIPRYSQAKFEISKELPWNPITQDTKKGKLRYVNNIFPFKGYPFNYGAFPQTWEDPTFEALGNKELYGDDDPLDVLELGSTVGKLGEIKTVKVLGALAMIDEGELDWKIITINLKDPMAKALTDINDVSTVMPGSLNAIRIWFKDYKRPTGKPENTFAFDGRYLGRKDAVSVIEQCNKRWSALVSGKTTLKGKKLPQILNSTIRESIGFRNRTEFHIEAYSGENGVPKPDSTVFYYGN
ncbi:hypothetical protein HII13_004944 [Brettanomyces bruxellensis]|nr:hypothetical protein HII13_004944 [Brettanomyces bruxellensis]